MDIPIITETDDMLIINKPAGLMVHGDGRSKEKTLADWLLETRPYMKEVGEPMGREEADETIVRPGIVHRLDRDTSGLLLIAKTHEAFSYYKEKFQDRDMSKEYVAYAYGHFKDDEITIDRPIARSRGDFRQWSAQRGSRGGERDAATDIVVVARGHDKTLLERGGKSIERIRARDASRVSLLSIFPKTGRTHQIRVHCKAINHPIVADTLYAPRREALLGFTRLALHSRFLRFVDMNGVEQQFEAPMPVDFLNALQTFVPVEKI